MGNCCERLFFKPERPQRLESSPSESPLKAPKVCGAVASNSIENNINDYGWKGSIMEVPVLTKDVNTSPILALDEKSPDICSSFKYNALVLHHEKFEIQKKLAYEAKEEKERSSRNRLANEQTPELTSKDILKTKV